jgi:hypothetical protein
MDEARAVPAGPDSRENSGSSPGWRDGGGRRDSSSSSAALLAAVSGSGGVSGRPRGGSARQRERAANGVNPPHERLLGEVLEIGRRGDVDVVVVSAVAPIHFLHVRSLCKRLLANESRVEILVGLWGEESNAPELARRLPDSNRIHVVTTIAQALSRSAAAGPRIAAQRKGRAVPA